MSSQTLDQELAIKIFEFWKSTPIIKTIDLAEFKSIFNAEARAQIIDILSQGIEDTNPRTNKIEKRHALTAKEISKEIKSKYNVKLEKSNLYFHINHLIEANLINIVAQIPSGKRITTYYGRSSKICAAGGIKKDHMIHDILVSDKLTELILEINPNLQKETIIKMNEDLKTINYWDYDVFEEWTNMGGSKIFDIDIDVLKLTSLMSLQYRFNPTVGKGLSKLAKLLNFKMVGVHEIPPELIKKYSPDNYVAGELDEDQLLNYWNRLPILTIIPFSDMENLLESNTGKHKKGEKIRNSILEVLRKGIETEDSTGKKRFRYLYTAKEILDGVNEILSKGMGDEHKIKRASLYFHLDKLENANFIRVAGYIPRGTSQRISYYGRTGKVISTSQYDDEEISYPTIRSKGLRDLIYRLNPDINKNDIEFLLQRVDFINKYSFATFPIWVERNEKFLEKVNIDLVKLSAIISILRRFNPEVVDGLKELSDLIQFKQAA
ncbi:MAG: hypothetical protein HeimC2_38480 [Candidatus Heimdallarchaeota archaeon LC_2]|nr:MAG: hypothetical protein HeimC2_38480 [Candidatus Heimdallarchaeota archaeon LC_2]